MFESKPFYCDIIDGIYTGPPVVNEFIILPADTYLTSLGTLRSIAGLDAGGISTLASLGDLEEVHGSLQIYETQVQDLGNLRKVSSDLDISETPITSLGLLEECPRIDWGQAHSYTVQQLRALLQEARELPIDVILKRLPHETNPLLLQAYKEAISV